MHRIPILMAAGAFFAMAGSAVALDMEKLIMPGPVIEGHADIEGDCSRCHTPFRSEAEKALCAECHEDIAGDIAHDQGLHGRMPAVGGSPCRSCHAEHLGRDADITGLDREAFDHRNTDFQLEGAHRLLDCGACHVEGKRLREAPSNCNGCHVDDDPHDGTLGESCEDCHSEASWQETRFDHSTTRFPLTGKHRDASCNLCHPGDHFEKVATDCQSCHGLDDVHLGRFGADCARCHSADGWRQTSFDHGRDTSFPLRGSHRALSCAGCHAADAPTLELPSDCVSCHRADDVHRGRNGEDCSRCHGEEDWATSRFDHDTATEFPLRGAHRQARCNQCHTDTLLDSDRLRSCADCHLSDDVHDGQQGRACGECHGEEDWGRGVFFEHDLTRMPLLGLHAVVACEQCHATPRFRDAKVDCSGCHAADSVHRGSLGTDCGRCHNPNGWHLWRFDHGKETSFALHGAHAELDCHACHGSRDHPDAVNGSCAECHARDDRHYGAFGRDCGRCHGDDTWSEVHMVR